MTRQIGQSLGIQIRESTSADRWNISPTDPVISVISARGKPEARMLRWSLVPPWATELKMRRPLFNARVEGLRDRGDYAGVTADPAHRALVLADGFYEWEHPEDNKQKPQPYRFTVDGGRVFAFAGVWATNKRIGERPIESCSIVTCDSQPNPLVHKVHDRMPVILIDREELLAWLSADVTADDALTLCRSLPPDRMSVEPRQPGSQDKPEQLQMIEAFYSADEATRAVLQQREHH